MTTKPLISYYGGKQRIAARVVENIPPHTVYCEPFAGGAAVFYRKPCPLITNGDYYREALNDINGDLVNLYRVAKESPDSFSSSVQALPFSAALHRGARAHNPSSSKERALLFFIDQQQSFANIRGAGWQRGTYGRDLAKTWRMAKRKVLAAAERLDAVSLDSIDAVDFIKKWDSPQTFFYLDPPYIGTHCEGMGPWNSNDQGRLLSALNDCKGSFILSSYSNFNDLRHVRCVEIPANCTATGKGKTRRTRNHGEPARGVGRNRIEKMFMRGPTEPVRLSLLPVLQRQGCFLGPLLGPCPLRIRGR